MYRNAAQAERAQAVFELKATVSRLTREHRAHEAALKQQNAEALDEKETELSALRSQLQAAQESVHAHAASLEGRLEERTASAARSLSLWKTRCEEAESALRNDRASAQLRLESALREKELAIQSLRQQLRQVCNSDFAFIV